MKDLGEKLKAGLCALGEDPDAHPCDRYLRYLKLLAKWNRAYNLSGIRAPDRMLAYHLLDSLSVLRFVHGKRCLDAGSGAGLPGLILALAQPARQWVLLDSNAKKIRFLDQARRELGAGNVEIAHARIESFRPPRGFSTIISRALWALPDFTRNALRLLDEDGVLLAMKGARPEREITDELRATMTISIEPLNVPGITSDRSLVILQPMRAASLRVN